MCLKLRTEGQHPLQCRGSIVSRLHLMNQKSPWKKIRIFDRS